jgi:chemotaxis protein CheY-P-specific phosphatase CheC
MKARERFDKILLSCCDRIQEEVASLIGKPFKLGEPKFRESSKEALFAEPGGKRVLAHVRIDGDLQGAACLLVGIKDAIQIGGALIMLPESELASLSAAEDYSEELQDSFGEVANIFCGAMTVTFEEQHPKKIRFIRTEQEVVVPVKVVIESEQPIADGSYYLMTVPMQLDNRDLGSLEVVFPAVLFGLAAEAAQETAPPVEAAAVQAAEPEAKEAPESIGTLKRQAGDGKASQEAGILERPVAAAPGPAVEPRRDLEKQHKLVDTLLKNSMAKMCEEVSALLGGTLQVVPTEHAACTKAGFLEQAGGKQIMARMDIRGEGQGEAFLFVDVKTAVYLGGSLIMLPEGELEAAVRSEDFGDDASDAYGEVTNIIAGVYTAVFEEQYRTKLGFVKTSMEAVTPVKVDPDSDEVLPNQPYYLSAGTIQYNGKDLGRLQLLLPARVLGLEDLLRPEEEATAPGEAERQGVPKSTTGKGAGQSSADPVRFQGTPSESADILIFTDDDAEGGRIAAILQPLGYVTRMLHFKDSVGSLLTPRIQMIFLVMQEVSEQGFGVAIKISSAGLSVPLVAAGPAWTRTLVLKAVKYGACDILITPAAPADVQEKIAFNLVKRAA